MNFHKKFIEEKAIWMVEYSDGRKIWEYSPETGEETLWNKDTVPSDGLKYLYLLVRPNNSIENIYGFDMETGEFIFRGDPISLSIPDGKASISITNKKIVYEPIQFKHVVTSAWNPSENIFEMSWNIGLKCRFSSAGQEFVAKVILSIDSKTFKPNLLISGHVL